MHPELNVLFDDHFAEMLCEKESLQERIHIIDRHLIAHLPGLQPVDPQIIRATDLIVRANGMLPIQQLTDKLYIGQRHFERKFKHITGYTPKEFSRITKFRYATRVLKTDEGGRYAAIGYRLRLLRSVPFHQGIPGSYRGVTPPLSWLCRYRKTIRLRHRIKKVDFLQQEAGSFLYVCRTKLIHQNMEKIKQQAIDLLNKCEVLTLASIDERGCPRPVVLSKIKTEGDRYDLVLNGEQARRRQKILSKTRKPESLSTKDTTALR